MAGGLLPVEPDGFLGRGEGVLRPPDLAVGGAEVVQRPGQVGEVGGVAGGQLPVQPDGFLGRGEGVLPPPDLAVGAAEVDQRLARLGR